MSKEQSILRIWNGHWGSGTPTSAEVLQNRFTKEAFGKINAFITESDRLILEVGCGTGRFCTLLACQHPNATVTGIDLSKNALAIACRLKSELRCENLSFIEANLFRLPFPDGYFDVVFSEGVISHFSIDETPTYADALSEMARVTRAGGRVIASVPNWYCFPHTTHKWLLQRLGIPYEYGYEKSFRPNELVRLFRRHGLGEVQFSGFHPAHTFYRLTRYSRLFRIAGVLTDQIERICDLARMGRFSRMFGFEIVAMGSKCPRGLTNHSNWHR
jgi:SAM-dependent methyltransferase